MDLPRGEVMIVATGGQGEPRAALSRIAEEAHVLKVHARRHRGALLGAADPRQRDRDRPRSMNDARAAGASR